ncbi:MAG: aldolase [Elusimicrobia bacterium]|nr:aldolase [Elusimicrobiota bacterium]
MLQRDKKLKERLKNGEMVFGTWNTLPSSSLVNAMGCSGIDFVVIDAEHGPVGMETAEDLVRALDVTGTASVIRVPTSNSHLILRALDIGAHGIQVPHVSTKEEAVRVVKCSKYYPQGQRGFSPFTRAGKYGIDAKGYTKRANEDTMVVINVEGKEGVRNLNEIAGVPGIDVVFIGPYDLSQSLGRAGEVEDSEVIKTIRQSVKIAKNRGISAGSFARDEKYLDILIDCGVQYITYTVDSALVSDTYRELYKMFSDKIGLH